ncbi:peptide chain release factor N(5)-glutamine methyltransferase [Patescibacteria group bacterium]|nr:peptide chain release factor N(5)-glutamine methyltransferase [Patescibacteria group bacterium]MBP9710549.1 peptide chain release factor N(5)-glutamine methyltransferase [Patescibacteria group bacterium]
MTIQEALRFGHEKLQSTLPYPEQAWKETETLLAFILLQERTWLVAHSEESLSTRQMERFFSLIERRAQHEPLAYLTGSGEFYGYLFHLNKYVLIPRVETEELIERASLQLTRLVQEREKNGAGNDLLVWDVGTGSGAIAISIKNQFPTVDTIASDVSEEALVVAKKNAARFLAPEYQPIFIQGSLLTSDIKEIILDHKIKTLVVVANLPYLPHSDKEVLQKSVVAYEPSIALFADEEGNALILLLAEQLAAFIKEYSCSLMAYFEFDPPQANTLKEKVQALFPEASVTIHQDAYERERFLEVNTLS